MAKDTVSWGGLVFTRSITDFDSPAPGRRVEIYVGPDEGDYCTVTTLYGDTGLTTYQIQRCVFIEHLSIWDWELLQMAERDIEQ